MNDRIQKLKAVVEYTDKALLPVCGNCIHYRSRTIKGSKVFPDAVTEKSKRCDLHGFGVKKMGSCNNFKRK